MTLAKVWMVGVENADSGFDVAAVCLHALDAHALADRLGMSVEEAPLVRSAADAAQMGRYEVTAVVTRAGTVGRVGPPTMVVGPTERARIRFSAPDPAASSHAHVTVSATTAQEADVEARRLAANLAAKVAAVGGATLADVAVGALADGTIDRGATSVPAANQGDPTVVGRLTDDQLRELADRAAVASFARRDTDTPTADPV